LPEGADYSHGFVKRGAARPVAGPYVSCSNKAAAEMVVAGAYQVDFAVRAQWKITLESFVTRPGLRRFPSSAIYILLVRPGQVILDSVVVMLAIPLTVLGSMPGFWLLNYVAG
jgi:multidrug efflux pump subunit AcrB